MDTLTLALSHPPSTTRTAVLILAAILLLTALQMAHQALAPVREILRAAAQVAVTVGLVFAAFALVVASIVV